MSPPPQVVLLDSNAYFRLAQSIRPLLGQTFGPPPPYSLFVLDILAKEFASSPRLQNKFEWVNQAEYRDDRRANTYEVKGTKWVAEVERAFSYFASYVKFEELSPSPEDIRALAVGYVKQIPVVSDDHDVRKVAAAHKISCLWSLDLLKLMLDTKRIDMEKVQEVVEYWEQQNDLPRRNRDDLRAQYKALFGQKCPI